MHRPCQPAAQFRPPEPRRWQAARPGPPLGGGNSVGSIGCSRSLQAERISLIGETEFVVLQRCNFRLNRLIQRDIQGDGSGFRVVRSRFSLYLCALAPAGPRRWSEQALPRSAQPLWFRRRLLFAGAVPMPSTTPSLIWPRRSSGHPSGRNIDLGERPVFRAARRPASPP